MPKKKKPNFFKTLFRVMGESLSWIIASLIPALIQIYQFFRGNTDMPNQVPAWIGFAPLAIYIVYVIVRTIVEYRNESAAYQLSNQISRKRRGKSVVKADNNSVAIKGDNSPVVKDSFNTTKAATAEDNSLALQDVKISNSFNNLNVPTGFYRPTREDLLHRIGFDIQRFHEKFKSFKYNSRIVDRSRVYKDVEEVFKPIYDELLPHANLILKNTSIPALIMELQRQLTICWMRLSDLSAQQEERLGWIKGNAPVPHDLLYRVDVTQQSLNEAIDKIETLVNQVINSIHEDKENRNWTSF